VSGPAYKTGVAVTIIVSIAAAAKAIGRQFLVRFLTEEAGTGKIAFGVADHAITSLKNVMERTLLSAQIGQEVIAADLAVGKATLEPANAAPYLAATYGGTAADWAKFYSRPVDIAGTVFRQEVHGFINIKTGQTVNVKTVINIMSIKGK
jgi:hypothetical protein